MNAQLCWNWLWWTPQREWLCSEVWVFITLIGGLLVGAYLAVTTHYKIVHKICCCILSRQADSWEKVGVLEALNTDTSPYKLNYVCILWCSHLMSGKEKCLTIYLLHTLVCSYSIINCSMLLVSKVGLILKWLLHWNIYRFTSITKEQDHCAYAMTYQVCFNVAHTIWIANTWGSITRDWPYAT